VALKEYNVGGYTFQLSEADVKDLEKRGNKVTPVEAKARGARNKARTVTADKADKKS